MSDHDSSEEKGPRFIDLNADLGEGFPHDLELLRRVSSASICCGGHAGDAQTIRATLEEAKARAVVVGAHPGFPDRAAMGRAERTVTAAAVEAMILEQAASLQKLAEDAGVAIRFLKPHGALYNQAQRQAAAAEGVLAASRALGLPLLAQPGSLVESLAPEHGVRCILEGFPDRRYLTDGSLAPRSLPGAVLRDPADVAAQVVRLARAGRVETLCIHGDEPTAVATADHVLQVLRASGVQIRSFME